MSQINLQVTNDFIKSLKFYMRKRGIKTKSQAIRQAIQDAVERISKAEEDDGTVGLEDLLGIGVGNNLNHSPHFKNDSELW
jgi:metal-responsive CopG/Arc/MetJ family transcriptional regulator